MAYLGPIEAPHEEPVSVAVPQHARIPRFGAYLFFLGVLLVAVSFAILAGEYYQLVYGPFPNGNQLLLWDNSQATLAVIGLVFVGVGWVLDQAAVERRMNPASPALGSGRRTGVLAIFLIGALCASAEEALYATLGWAAYAGISINVWSGTLPTFEATLAIGAFLMALAWIVRHVQSLDSIENRIP